MNRHEVKSYVHVQLQSVEVIELKEKEKKEQSHYSIKTDEGLR